MLNFEVIDHPQSQLWVVFIHGAGGSIKTWSSQIGAFKKEYNLLLLDLRDHGESKNLAPAYDRYVFRIISNDIIQVINHLGIKSAYFVSLSFGSVLLQDFSMKYPSLVKKAVMAGGIFQANIAIKMFVHLARFWNRILDYPTMYNVFSRLLMPRRRNLKARRLYRIQAMRLSQEEYLKWIGLYSEFFKLLGSFHHQKINFQTQILMGADDYIFLRAAKKFARLHDLVDIKVLPKTGHICNIEASDEFNRAVLQFFKTI